MCVCCSFFFVCLCFILKCGWRGFDQETQKMRQEKQKKEDKDDKAAEEHTIDTVQRSRSVYSVFLSVYGVFITIYLFFLSFFKKKKEKQANTSKRKPRINK